MKTLQSRVLWGVLLIIGGILFLLDSLGVDAVGAVVGPALFGIASGVFLVIFAAAPQRNWWAGIPGFVLLGLAGTSLLDAVAPRAADAWGGSLFLGGIALAFWAVYLVDRQNWWAVIPGGVLLTLAVVAGISEDLQGMATGGLLFLGMGLTFTALAILPTGDGRLTWALIPAAILVVTGALIWAAAAELVNYVWPAALILGGFVLLYRAFGSG